jgi:hypothetical protein
LDLADLSALAKKHGTDFMSHVICGGRAIIRFWTFSCRSLTISLNADRRRPDRGCPHAIYGTCDMKRSLFLMRRKKTFTRILPMTRNLHGVVPDGFTPIHLRTSKGDQVTRYPCTKQTRTLTGEIRRCSWVGRKDRCFGHDSHAFTLHPDEGPHAPRLITPILNRAKLNSRILTLAAGFVTATNPSCR